MSFEPHLHWSFSDEHVLLPAIVLHSFGSFLVACFLVMAICLSERSLTFLLEKQWVPSAFRLSRMSLALWRTGLYSLATFLRLCYMLIAMTCHLGLISVIVITLSAAQFIIELQNQPKPPINAHDTTNAYLYDSTSQPLLTHEEHDYPLKSVKTRPRSKSKPDAIFIHPAESNIARADAVALEMGLAGDTELVKGYSYTKEEPAWEIGKGKDLAREMLLGAKKKSLPREPFFIDDDSDSSE
ncbi:copper transporter [Flammula alnicola]|nr:copper transporter [Flammula alnicola]